MSLPSADPVLQKVDSLDMSNADQVTAQTSSGPWPSPHPPPLPPSRPNLALGSKSLPFPPPLPWLGHRFETLWNSSNRGTRYAHGKGLAGEGLRKGVAKP